MQKRNINLVLIILFLVFSIWLFGKSFGYEKGEFRISRHQVGDFGLHLSLIRSFSFGNNFPPESPFYPGLPLPYHYALDLTVGLLERAGIRIDYALNGISIISFTVLLFLIYRFSQVLFGENVLLGLFSSALFLFPSTLSFVEFFRKNTLLDVWHLPDYIHKGPFDGSIISLFFTLNPFLNQRHLIAGLAISMTIFLFVVEKLIKNKNIHPKSLFILGVVIGLSTRVHSLVAFGTATVVALLLLFFKKARNIFIFAMPVFIFALPHMQDIGTISIRLNPGYLVQRPINLFHILQFWWLNLGLSLILIPVGFYFASRKQRKVFLAFFVLFLMANMFQFSYRIEHNHSLVTLFFIVANIFSASILVKLPKVAILFASFVLFSSGFLNLMAIKNDFQYNVPDAPKDAFIEWIKTSTPVDAIFLAKQDLYDPVTFAGRKNYFGATYYLEVMGYDIATRSNNTAKALDDASFARQEGIDYIVVTNDETYGYTNEKEVYKNNQITVFAL